MSEFYILGTGLILTGWAIQLETSPPLPGIIANDLLHRVASATRGYFITLGGTNAALEGHIKTNHKPTRSPRQLH